MRSGRMSAHPRTKPVWFNCLVEASCIPSLSGGNKALRPQRGAEGRRTYLCLDVKRLVVLTGLLGQRHVRLQDMLAGAKASLQHGNRQQKGYCTCPRSTSNCPMSTISRLPNVDGHTLRYLFLPSLPAPFRCVNKVKTYDPPNPNGQCDPSRPEPSHIHALYIYRYICMCQICTHTCIYIYTSMYVRCDR